VNYASRFEPVVRRLDPTARLIRVRELSGGMSAQITVLDIAKRGEAAVETVVVRQYGPINTAADPQVATTETRLLHHLRAAGLAVPQPWLADDSDELLGGPYSVIGYIDAGDPPQVWSESLCAQLVDVLVGLHRIDPSPVASLLPADADRVQRWLSGTGRAPDEAMRETAIRDVLTDWWPRRRELPHRILHGDFWPGNTMWAEDRLVAMIDWEDAAIGDQRCDLANIRLELLWAYGPRAVTEFTDRYAAAYPEIDLGEQPYWDLVAATRPAGRPDEWGLDPEHRDVHLTRFTEFVDAALAEVAAQHRR
jgi:aminoglycoside phosphotransferase (APT) family kinase protein